MTGLFIVILLCQQFLPPLSVPQLQKGKKYLGEKTMFFREGRPPDALGVDFFPKDLLNSIVATL